MNAEAKHRELLAAVDQAQGDLDRVRRHLERTVRYHDDCPDGDPRKADADRQLDRLLARKNAAEAVVMAAVDALLDYEDETPA